ncbi:MAG: hypothetical protein ACRDQ7_06725 [Haloechinothrix sp.]
MGRHSKTEPSAPPPGDGLTDTGSHRAIASTRPRGVAKWPIACLGAVALIALTWIGLVWGNNVLNHRAEAQANSCTGGRSTLRVTVAPSIEQPVIDAAETWNASDQVVHDRCITVDVRSAESQGVVDMLGQSGTMSKVPAAWIPESTQWASELREENPRRVIGEPASVTSAKSADYPFVVIGGEGVDPVQERAAQTFRHFLLDREQRALFAEAGFSG